jgi:hypothetical protein
MTATQIPAMMGMMKAVIARLAVLALLAITAYCPSQAWALREPASPSDSCCPNRHSTPDRRPCDTTAQTCPYLLLQKSKAIPIAIAAPPLQVRVAPVAIDDCDCVALAPAYVSDSKGLYLRNRVLLI